jgi:hypothetical protein
MPKTADAKKTFVQKKPHPTKRSSLKSLRPRFLTFYKFVAESFATFSPPMYVRFKRRRFRLFLFPEISESSFLTGFSSLHEKFAPSRSWRLGKEQCYQNGPFFAH